MIVLSVFYSYIKEITRETVLVYSGLIKIILPVMIVVEIITRMGAIDMVAQWMSPIMDLVGLPAATSIVLATNMFIGFYGAAAALIVLLPSLDLTIADASVLSGMMLMAHALPIEHGIIRKTGCGIFLPLIFRLLFAFLYGLLLHYVFEFFALFQSPAAIVWSFEGPVANDFVSWLLQAGQMLVWVFLIILGLMSGLKILEITGITDRIVNWLAPFLRHLGIGPNAAPMVMVGALLGLAFGGGLIIREVEKNHLTPRSLFLSMYFMMLCHGLIEDSLMAMTLGGHWGPSIVGRILFAIAVGIILKMVIFRISDDFFFRYLLNRPAVKAEETT